MNYYNTYVTRLPFVWRFLSFNESYSSIHGGFIHSLKRIESSSQEGDHLISDYIKHSFQSSAKS